MTFTGLLLLGLLIQPLAAAPLSSPTDTSDVRSPADIVRATYEAISRAPGKPFEWERFRNLFLPEARLIPNTEQTRGQFTVHTVQSFIDWIDNGWKQVIGTANDRGFAESEVSNVIEEYGDIAHVLSTYEKHIWGETRVQGRGINSFQLVKRDGRWWIAGVIWDEENGAGPVPEKYLRRRA